jgi:hypothetical protein
MAMLTFCAAAAPDISASAPSAAKVFRMAFTIMIFSLDDLRRTIKQATEHA